MEYITITNPKKDHFVEVDDKEIKVWNGYYKCYTSEYCKLMGLPMLNHETYKDYAEKWLSPSRCKKAGKPVQEGEKPVAFYRLVNGYCPLYDRTQ